jgi:predicted small integral membrane protein
MNLSWMAWTMPTALFFGGVALLLAGMTAWQIVQPSEPRRGLLPIATTRGDRLFIGLLGAAFLHLAWLALATEQPLWIASAIAAVWLAAAMRYG